MRIGVLTGGGDCPGLNAVLYGIVKEATLNNHEIIGFIGGWRGILQNETKPLTTENTRGIMSQGGTILLTSRTNLFPKNDEQKKQENIKTAKETFKSNHLDGFIAIGGEDTLGVASQLAEQGFPIVGVPKTIDNDLSCTDVTFGFDTAVNTASECLERVKTTAASHQRSIVVEIMGRHAGWLALHAGLAGGADYILIPEVEVDLDDLCKTVEERQETQGYSVIAVSEGAVLKDQMNLASQELDSFGHVRLGGIAESLSQIIEKRTGVETRFVNLGHVQRGGSPSASDRILGQRFGIKAIQMLQEKQFGSMACLSGTQVIAADLKKAVGTLKTVPKELYQELKPLFRVS